MKQTSTKDKFNIITGRDNPLLVEYQKFLIHKDVLAPFKKLQNLAKEEIGADLQLISSFRDFQRQQMIWNNKATGKRKILDDNDNILDFETLSKEDLLEKIMRFSAIPGLSRHHWGTDFDIFDANKIKKEEVMLTHSECIEGGPLCDLHLWLDNKIANGESFEFFRPYDKDLGGISIEKWHISYAPISQSLWSSYDLNSFKINLEDSQIELKEIILDNIEFYFEKYFKLITFP